MNFIKGALIGMMAGTVVGAINSNTLKGFLKKGTNTMKKMVKM